MLILIKLVKIHFIGLFFRLTLNPLNQTMKFFPLIYRRLLYIMAILLFLIVTGLTLSYALGYRYDFDSGNVKKVGFLTIAGNPETVQVFINGQERASKLPGEIRNLLPGEYLVEIKKAGYQMWSKKLTVEESMVTAVKSVQLVLNEQKIESILETAASKNSVLSNDSRLAAWINKDSGVPVVEIYDFQQLSINNINLDSLKLPINVSAVIDGEIISWSPDNNWLLLKITGQNNRFYLALNSQNLTASYLITNFEGKFIWDTETAGQLFLLNQKKLFQQNKTGSSPILKQADFYDINNFAAANYGLSLIGEAGQTSVLWHWQNTKTESQIIFTGSGKLEFCPFDSDQLCLYNPADKKSMLLVNNILIPLGENIKQSSTAPTGDKILLLGTNELYLLTHSLADKNTPVWNKKLLTRYSNPILRAFWHFSANQIIFLLPNEIKMIETDFLDQPLQFSLGSNLELNAADQIVFSRNKKDPYFYFFEFKANKLHLSKITWQ